MFLFTFTSKVVVKWAVFTFVFLFMFIYYKYGKRHLYLKKQNISPAINQDILVLVC